MKKIALLTISLSMMVSLALAAPHKDLQEYCQQIDDAIAHSADYIAAHERRIGEARRALALETTPTGKYQRNFRLYELYKPFVSFNFAAVY